MNTHYKRLVIKLGGSVLSDDESYLFNARKIAQLAKNLEKLYVVVSAQKGMTDRLINSVGLDYNRLMAFLRGESPRNGFDHRKVARHLLSGEIYSVGKLADYLDYFGVHPAILIQGNGFPIVADGSYLYASVDLEKSLRRRCVLGGLDSKVVLVPGFGAENPSRETVLLGKNSSDLVAAVVACVDGHIDELVYLKDVDGVYHNFGSDGESLVGRMTFEQARSFDLGKLLDKRSLEFANCAVRIQSYEAPVGSGTVITRN